MDYKVIIFDKDGTLLDFDTFWLAVSDGALEEIISISGVSASKDELLRVMGVENGVTDINGILCRGTYAQMGEAIYSVLASKGCGLSLGDVTELTKNAYHSNFSKGKVAPTCENIKEALTKLRDMGCILAVITTDDSNTTEKCLRELGITEFFDTILCDDGINPPKPDPFGISVIKEKYNVSESQILMVGDTITDMMFAKAGGVDAIGVGKSDAAKAILKSYTDRVYDDISFIPGVIK